MKKMWKGFLIGAVIGGIFGMLLGGGLDAINFLAARFDSEMKAGAIIIIIMALVLYITLSMRKFRTTNNLLQS
ncbi:hypothetical protein [Macrococcus equipercicus]|uniref:Uncharacterized protein n=1 Tax=Macrococcus equipercicus TaxID=69967 RepID=A0A9Q9BLP2_9STAP|nr:hypothetical protein [Macrococcus equipercicus]KAA1036607.1 hypothetical protein ERX35_010680 [Macrococcus equipercicus]UTH13460.1 hypothetical protein KFV11_09535 [Macrococcus equipercicus]